MFPPEIDYRRAESVEEAIEALAAASDARPIAGGQGIVPSMKRGDAAPDCLVDVGSLDALSGIEWEDGTGEEAVVGALTTHAAVANSVRLARHTPALPATATHVADRQIRNRGTIGGNLVEADPAADLPAAVVAAGATLAIRGPEGERTVPAGEWFRGDGETALDGDELLVAVRVPAADRGAYVKKTHPATGYAMVGVAASLSLADGAVADAGLAAVGVAERPIELSGVAAALAGTAPDDEAAVAAAAERATEDLESARGYGDGYASAAFRERLLPTYVERAIDRALGEPTRPDDGDAASSAGGAP
ncbi:MAG: xanthine dehydrogenase family protein subunit M [Haloarculaceae archaeon]